MRFSATSSPRRTPIAMDVTTGPKCVRRKTSVRGSPSLTLMVSVRTSMSRHWPSRRYWFGWFGSVLRRNRSAWSAPRAVRPQAMFGVKPIRMLGLPATPRPRALKVLPLMWNSYHSEGLRTGVCGSLTSTVEPVVVFLPPMTQAWLNLGPGGTSVAGHVHLSRQVVLRRVVQDLLHPRVADIAALDHRGIVADGQAAWVAPARVRARRSCRPAWRRP